MMKETDEHQICRALDERMTIMGLGLEEFIPLFGVFLLSFLTHTLLVGMVLMVLVFAGFKHLKRRGAWVLWVYIFRHSTDQLGRLVLPGCPSPTIRHWW